MHRRTALLFVCLFIASAAAQPTISSFMPVVNAASLMGSELAGHGIAQGSLFVIQGSGFGASDSYSPATTYPLQRTLGGVSVKISVGGTTTSAIMLLVAYGYYIEAVLPSATPVGTGSVTVSYGGASTSAPIVVVPAGFGIFSANSQGNGQAIATDPAFSQNSIIHTFHPGDVAILWGTGLGAVSWDETEPPPLSAYVSLPVDVQVYVGDKIAPAEPTDYHGRSNDAGLDQINFTVPAGVEGCYVPVAVKAGGVMSNFTTIAISGSGDTCSDSVIGQDLIDKLANGQSVNFGWIRLEGGASSGDYMFATFNQFTPANVQNASFGVSSGYCMTAEWGSSNGPFLSDFSMPYLDAGPALTLQGASGTYQAPAYYSYPGTYGTLLSTTQRVLWAGLNFTVSGPGGNDVGQFQTSQVMPIQGSIITNIPRYSNRPRNSDLLVTWDASQFPDPNGSLVLGGASIVLNADGSVNVYSELQCTAPVTPGQFTIPAFVLSTLPASGTFPNGSPTAYLWLGQYSPPTTFTAVGLDKGLITAATYALTEFGLQ